jgi:hypothetical protein
MDASQNSILKLIRYGMECYYRGKDAELEPSNQWPLTWRKVKTFIGYTPPQTYWARPTITDGLFDWKTVSSVHCAMKVKAPYPTTTCPFQTKFVVGVLMRSKMTAHWVERAHWLGITPITARVRRELWDGDRFAELSWFWDSSSRWMFVSFMVCKVSNWIKMLYQYIYFISRRRCAWV